MGFIKNKIKQAARQAGDRAVTKHITGERKPSRSLHGSQGHERIDALRPGVPPIGVFLLAVGVGLLGLVVWMIQGISKTGGVVWIIATVCAVLMFHTVVFRWCLVARKAAYTDGWFFPTSQLFKGASKVLGPARVTVILLVSMTLLLLFTQLAGPSSFFGWLSTVTFGLTMAGAVITGIKLGCWYTKDERKKYQLLWAVKVTRIEELPGDLVNGMPIQLAHFDDKFTAVDLPALQKDAESNGYTITGYNFSGRDRKATLTPVTPMELKAYKDIARNLGKDVYDFELRFEWVENDEADKDVYPERIETLTVIRPHIGGLTPEKRAAFWIAVRDSLPKASNGWTVTDKQDSSEKVLHYGKPLALPDTVALPESLPSKPGIDQWSRIPVGRNSAGAFVGMNLLRVPHILVAGGTGSGKSTLLRADMLGRLVRGHDIVVIDTVKGGNDFLTLKPWSLMWGESIAEAANILAHIYEEAARRRAFLKKYKIGNWTKLTPEQRAEGGIRPLSIFYDEYENSIVARTAPKALDKEHPLVLAAQAHNISVDFIKQYMPQLAKEARSVGIHLVVATQTPHSGRIGDDLRGNLGGAIQLSAGKLEQHIVRLAMGEATMQAMDQFQRFNKPKLDERGNKILDDDGNDVMLPGLGVVLMEGGAPTAMRVAYAPEPQLPEVLTDLKIAEVDPWRLSDALELNMAASVDEDDTRARVDPPFGRMSHLLGAEGSDSGSEVQDSMLTQDGKTFDIFDPKVWGK